MIPVPVSVHRAHWCMLDILRHKVQHISAWHWQKADLYFEFLHKFKKMWILSKIPPEKVPEKIQFVFHQHRVEPIFSLDCVAIAFTKKCYRRQNKAWDNSPDKDLLICILMRKANENRDRPCRYLHNIHYSTLSYCTISLFHLIKFKQLSQSFVHVHLRLY